MLKNRRCNVKGDGGLEEKKKKMTGNSSKGVRKGRMGTHGGGSGERKEEE